MEILFRHDVGAPRRDAAGTVVHRADGARASRIDIGLQAIVAGGRAGNFHGRVGSDTAIVFAVGDDLPLAAGLADFDDGAAMRRHFDIHLLLAERALLDLAIHDLDEAREHQVRVGVFVVDDEQAVLARTFERNVADIVVVVAELLALRIGGLFGRIEFRRAGQDGIAPAQQDIGVITFGHVVAGINAGFHFCELEGGPALILGTCLVGTY